MKTTLDIPEPIARRIGALASRNGRAVTDQIVQVLRILLASDASVKEWETILNQAESGQTDVIIRAGHHGRVLMLVQVKGSADALPMPVLALDRATGLPVVNSPPDAPIHGMSGAEFQAVVDEANEEDDLVRAGLPIRR